MEKTGWIEIFNTHSFDEWKAMQVHQAVPTASIVLEKRRKMLADLKEVGKTGDMEVILSVEKSLLKKELELHANSAAMRTSLQTAVAEMERTEELLSYVKDPAAYRAEIRAHTLPKNRIGPLPRDEARQFFRSHDARLLNMDKSRLDDVEKVIIEIRKHNIRIAEKSYIQKQEQALGIVRKDKGPKQGLSR